MQPIVLEKADMPGHSMGVSISGGKDYKGPTQKTPEGEYLLKIQVPMARRGFGYAVDMSGPMLVYSRDHKVHGMFKITHEFLKQLSGRPKGYFQCQVTADGKIKILKNMGDLSW